jgi:hypothetical protein
VTIKHTELLGVNNVNVTYYVDQHRFLVTIWTSQGHHPGYAYYPTVYRMVVQLTNCNCNGSLSDMGPSRLNPFTCTDDRFNLSRVNDTVLVCSRPHLYVLAGLDARKECKGSTSSVDSNLMLQMILVTHTLLVWNAKETFLQFLVRVGR